MMAEKARLFGDAATLEKILAAPSPKSAKTLGRKVQNFDLAVWTAHCRDIVTRGNVEKFRQHASLRKFLLGTAGKVIVEASPSDRIWGIGLRQSDERAMDPRRWPGRTCWGLHDGCEIKLNTVSPLGRAVRLCRSGSSYGFIVQFKS